MAGGRRRKEEGAPPADWIAQSSSTDPMEGPTAQVTPAELTSKLWAAAERAGATLIIDTVVGIVLDCDDTVVVGVSLESGTSLPADKVVLAMGTCSHTISIAV